MTEVSRDHFYAALKDSIESINAELRRPYEIAVKQPSDDYEEILWSTADSDYLDRYLKDMYVSYKEVMKQRPGTPLDYEKYSTRIRNLKTKKCGEILVADQLKRGLYTYKEKMLRGYVRMQAEAHEIQLLGEQNDDQARQTAHVPTSARRGYHGSMVPKGISLSRKRDR